MTTTDQTESTANERANGLTDSPWFWGAAFCIGGLVALAAGSNVYDARQDRIEQRFQVRNQVGLPSSIAGTPGAELDAESAGRVVVDTRRKVPIAPLAVACAAGAAGCGYMLVRTRAAQRK